MIFGKSNNSLMTHVIQCSPEGTAKTAMQPFYLLLMFTLKKNEIAILIIKF